MCDCCVGKGFCGWAKGRANSQQVKSHPLEHQLRVGEIFGNAAPSGGFRREVVEECDATIELPFLELSMPMQEIYDGIEFTPTCMREPESGQPLSGNN